MEQVKRLRQAPTDDPNLALGRLLISIGNSVAILQEMVENLGARLEEPSSGEWHQLAQGIINALQHFQQRIEDEGQVH
jgi:hypothetical protein